MYIIFLKLFLAALLNHPTQNSGTLTLKAEMPNSVYKKEDLLVKLTLFNSTSNPIFIHQYQQLGYMSWCNDDYCFKVEKIANSNFLKLEELAAIDRIPGYDSSGVPWDSLYNTIPVGESHVDTFNILGYYHLTKGKYRLRFCFNLPSKNNSPAKQIYSNWIYFEVKSKRVEYMYF